ncbi:MAG: protein phosphatase 2C domain-containing protein [Melioribacteraceae bacterium]|nr:protein phosphatase 2C domain-containing protein [Melioribacteraceae bacterium]MCF8355929.1 protein phosphatase 2C domain-containing protein [Melioribacteraceae bacterium]MCF8395469.1 protein phosphatase 2C domain-containing protein [Melioribacteraceae bacterium]MCF8420777.1 protein phosphatase 2C domain-containing protein [Melioribacteraceae bacterium]
MKLYIDAVCDVGSVRDKNEDMVLLVDEFFRNDVSRIEIKTTNGSRGFIFAVADGMGGHAAGEIASEIILSELSFTSQNISPNLNEDVLKSIFQNKVKEIHQKLLDEGKNDPEKYGMGATLIAVLFYQGKVFFFNAGDSRLYRFRRGFLKQLSRDHSLSAVAGVDRTVSHMILNSIGGGDNVFLDFEELTDNLIDDDVLLLCSDGLSDMIDDNKIEELLNENVSALKLVQEAKEAGGKDNISVILIRIMSSED